MTILQKAKILKAWSTLRDLLDELEAVGAVREANTRLEIANILSKLENLL